MAAVDADFVAELSYELQSALIECENTVDRQDLLRKHLELLERKRHFVVPDLEKGLEWFNTERPLSLQEDLRGKVVVIDFFTFCCINCMHILPDLAKLESKHSIKDGLIVIGVHSAKFENEKVSSNILNAVLRYDITHPVVNDVNTQLWNKLHIQCWPTLVVLGPQNQMLLSLMGEGNQGILAEFVDLALEFYKAKGQISDRDVCVRLDKDFLPPSPLLFPGKVCISKQGQLAISDTGHHQILILGKNGLVQDCIGSGKARLEDGDFKDASFHAPQGLAWKDNQLYVADTENHAIRQINFDIRKVTTVAGTGSQGHDLEGGKVGTEQVISSPWDLTLGSSVGSCEEDVLFVAMAGSHQVWLISLQDIHWLKGKEYKRGSCVRFAGSGREENRNNNYPHSAGFAQPSGIALGKMGDSPCLFVADSESSSVRTISLVDGAVKGFVGGSKDPLNLFAYGDTDGQGFDAKLQHPLAVSYDEIEGRLLVADSYNHKIKTVNVQTKECSTLIGSGKPGNKTGGVDADIALSEPGGICLDAHERLLFIADTNNHSVKVFNFENSVLSELPIITTEIKEKPVAMDIVDGVDDTVDVSAIRSKTHRSEPKSTEEISMKPLCVAPGSTFTLQLDVELGNGLHLTPDAPSSWQMFLQGEMHDEMFPDDHPRKGALESLDKQPTMHFTIPPSWTDTETDIRVEVILFFCDDSAACRRAGFVLRQPIVVRLTSETSNQNIVCKLHHLVMA